MPNNHASDNGDYDLLNALAKVDFKSLARLLPLSTLEKDDDGVFDFEPSQQALFKLI